MVKKLLSLFLVLLFSGFLNAQQSNDEESKEKTNPIIFGEVFGGFSGMKHFGFVGGAELNYQYKKSLFSFRYANVVGYISNEVNPYFPLPTYYKSDDNSEYAVLYGRRWMTNRNSFSISTGISCNNLDSKRRIVDDREETYYYDHTYETFYGVPFEASFKWFYKRKKSKLIYNAMIPSIGVKLLGNISRNSYLGVGVSVGFGFSKQY